MLNVWASWCAPCREEHPLLVDFARRKLVPVYGLNYKDSATGRHGLAGAARQPLRGVAVRRATAASASTSASTACPRPSSSTSRASIRFKHIGPLTPEVLRDEDRAAAEGTQCLSRLRRWLLALLLAAAAGGRRAKEAAPAADDPVLEARVMRIAAELRCLVCQNQTIADSHADLAQ